MALIILHRRKQVIKTQPFTRNILNSAEIEALRSNRRWFDADILKYKNNGVSWVIKDFGKRHWFVRNTIGRYYIQREFRAMAALRDIKGMSQDVFRMDTYALCYQFIPGRDVRYFYDVSNNIKPEFFERLEKLVCQMHACNVVHLDIRNGENVIITADETPFLIDFQSAFSTKHMPAFLRDFFRKIDLSGVYKHWTMIAPSSIPGDKQKTLNEVNSKRKFWMVNKWPMAKKIHKIFNHKTTRKIFLKLRIPLTLVAVALLIMNARQEFFWYGLGVSWVGELLQVWCFASLKKQKKLACNGPYAVSRNPMYIGRFFIILGGVVLTGNPYVIAGYSFLYYFYMVNRVKREEETLKPIFGKDYEDYCRNVNRFVPTITRNNIKTLPFFKWELFVRNHAHLNIIGTLVAWLVLYYFVFIQTF